MYSTQYEEVKKENVKRGYEEATTLKRVKKEEKVKRGYEEATTSKRVKKEGKGKRENEEATTLKRVKTRYEDEDPHHPFHQYKTGTYFFSLLICSRLILEVNHLEIQTLLVGKEIFLTHTKVLKIY